MPRQRTTLQKIAWAFAALFLFVYLPDYALGIFDKEGLPTPSSPPSRSSSAS